MRSKYIQFISAICILVLITNLFVVVMPAEANHSFHANIIEVCLNGVVMDGFATESSSLNLPMVGQVFDSGSSLVASTNSHTFTSVGETFRFQVDYPVGTFSVGEQIIVSVSDVPGTFNGNEGFADFVTVNNCMVKQTLPCRIGDGRINDADCAAPIAIYEGSIDVYGINPDTGVGSLAIRISDSDIEKVGISDDTNLQIAEGVNRYTGQPITVYRLTTGEIQVNTAYADGKPYVVAWPIDAPEKLYIIAH